LTVFWVGGDLALWLMLAAKFIEETPVGHKLVHLLGFFDFFLIEFLLNPLGSAFVGAFIEKVSLFI
jgi:hypothetical protein